MPELTPKERDIIRAREVRKARGATMSELTPKERERIYREEKMKRVVANVICIAWTLVGAWCFPKNPVFDVSWIIMILCRIHLMPFP